jgi:hypothetical protein
VETVGVPCEYPPGLLDQPLPATGGSTVLLVVAACLVAAGVVLRKVSA